MTKDAINTTVKTLHAEAGDCLADAPTRATTDFVSVFEPGDKVMRGSRAVETVRYVSNLAGFGEFLRTDQSIGVVRSYALVPPDADGDLVAIINALAAGIVLAIRRRIPSAPCAVHTSTALVRVRYPDLGPCDAAPMVVHAPADNACGHIAIHECAYAACYGATPREALHRIASMLYHQFVMLGEGASPLASWVEREMATASVPVMDRAAFVNECTGDCIAKWLDAIDTMAMIARAGAPDEMPRP